MPMKAISERKFKLSIIALASNSGSIQVETGCLVTAQVMWHLGGRVCFKVNCLPHRCDGGYCKPRGQKYVKQ